MKEQNQEINFKSAAFNYFMNPKKWWGPLLFILIISLAGVGLIGYQTYHDAPPFTSYVDAGGQEVIPLSALTHGQEVFHKYALMEYGSFFGDGAQRGPDFTAEALHEIVRSMQKSQEEQFTATNGREPSDAEKKIMSEEIKKEIKINRYDRDRNVIELSATQVSAFNHLVDYYSNMFLIDTDDNFPPPGYITDRQELADLAAFFYWGAWVCVVERPGTNFSYTHNWPYDPEAANTPTASVILWSVLGLLGFVLVCGIVLYFIGQYNQLPNRYFKQGTVMLTEDKVDRFEPTKTQKAAYKFFFVAILLFLCQVLAGVWTINEFVDFLGFFGINTSTALPFTITRSWHLMLALYWISACWIASSIFILPILAKKEIKGQLPLINTLFVMVFILVAGSVAGMFLGPKGFLGEYWLLLGHQGWEYVDFGKVYQVLLMGIFVLWGVIVYRGVKPAFERGRPWNLPNWIMYSVLGIPLLFISGFISRPDTNFVIADFWRWMVIHMWVEAFFEVFITVIVSYLMVLMGLVSRNAAIRVVYIATVLFLGTGLLGISHNFYWNAKPVATMALGSIFSTLQFVPLILLTVEAFRFKSMPDMSKTNGYDPAKPFAFPEVFKFLIAVNFWNFFGAGVMGIIVNLPIMNYFEHGTYLTVNHGHAALMGVYGNVSLAALLFAGRMMIKPQAWNGKLVNFAFWSINAGLMFMVILDLFPAGAIQFRTVVEKGYWFARSAAFIHDTAFESLTWLRGIGATVFLFGGVIPLALFIATRINRLKKTTTLETVDIDKGDSADHYEPIFEFEKEPSHN